MFWDGSSFSVQYFVTICTFYLGVKCILWLWDLTDACLFLFDLVFVVSGILRTNNTFYQQLKEVEHCKIQELCIMNNSNFSVFFFLFYIIRKRYHQWMNITFPIYYSPCYIQNLPPFKSSEYWCPCNYTIDQGSLKGK